MYKEKLLAYYQADPKRAVLSAIGLAILLALSISGIVLAAQSAKETARREAEQIVLRQAEQARLAAEAELAAKQAVEEKARLAAEAEKAAIEAAEAERIAVETEKAAEAKRIADVKAVADENAAAKAKAVKVAPKTTVDNSGLNCVRVPANINAMLRAKNPGPAPDGASYKGKSVCHVIANGKKDNPHNSSSNNKGKKHNGGLCLDPDERPMPPNDGNNCYPAAVYGSMISKYVANPW